MRGSVTYLPNYKRQSDRQEAEKLAKDAAVAAVGTLFPGGIIAKVIAAIGAVLLLKLIEALITKGLNRLESRIVKTG